MRDILVVAEKEFRSHLESPIAYFVTGIFLLLTGATFAMYLVGTGYVDTSIRGFLDAAPLVILALATLLTMRLIAEERKVATWEFMMTAPVGETAIVVGKFLGSLAMLSLMLLLTLLYPLLLLIFGDPDLAPIATSYVGLFLLAAAALAVGIFASSLTSNQLLAAVIAGAILLSLWFLGAVALMLPGGAGQAVAYLSLSEHMPDFARGIVDSRGVLYYASVAVFFLFLAIRVIEAERWR